MLRIIFDYLKLCSNLRKSPKEIEELQWRKFKKLIEHAYFKVPFYRERFDQFGIKPDDIKTKKDLIKIPITTKDDLRVAGEKVFAKGVNIKKLLKSRTSGSTGEPFVSYFDRRAWSILKLASKIRARRQCGLAFGDKVVNIEVYSPNETEQLNKKFSSSNFIFPFRYLSIHDDFAKHLEFYNFFQPNILYGLPSYFLEFGGYLKENNKKLPRLKMIFTSGELMNKEAKRKIEELFDVPVYDIYGTTEVKEVAWESPACEGYHINDDLYLVEFLTEEKYDPAIIITSLEQYAMPFIRYSVGDRGDLLNKNNGSILPFSAMRPAQGREVDYIIAPASGKKISPYAITMAMENISGIEQYQVAQIDFKNIEVNIRSSRLDKEEIEKEIGEILKLIIGQDVNTIINFLDKIPREASGKYRVVKSYVTK